MKVTQEKPRKVFHPVTITFETLEELTHFVDVIGKMKGGIPVPFNTWNRLADITRGPGNP
jgi:hypothetical protein